MRTASTIKFWAPAVLVILGYAAALLTASYSKSAFLAVHFPLEVIILASLIGSIIVVVSLFSRRSQAQFRMPFLLNALILAAMFLWLLVGVGLSVWRGI